jgi:hypothetical protein
MYFFQANCAAELDSESQKNALNISHVDNENLYNKFFSKDQSKRTQFDRISCQFAIHYMLKNEDTWRNFKNNINGYLRNEGYFIAITFDGRKVMDLLGSNDKYTQYYTDDNGKSKMLFEIIKKYNQPSSPTDIIGVGNAIDVYIAWFSLEGRYLTEYLVDSKYIVEDLKKDCNLELVSTDSCENQLIIHEQFLNVYAKYESIPATQKFLSNVSQFYNQTNINVNLKPWINLFRYYVFRKNKQNITQKGGDNIDKILDFSDKKLYYVPSMTEYDNNYSCTNSIHHILKSHKVIPNNITPKTFYSDVGIGSINDKKINQYITKLSNITVYEKIEDQKESKVINGLDIYIIERDCNGMYDVDLTKTKKTKKNLSIVLMKEGLMYAPVYYIDPETDKKIGLYDTNHHVIKKLFEEV